MQEIVNVLKKLQFVQIFLVVQLMIVKILQDMSVIQIPELNVGGHLHHYNQLNVLIKLVIKQLV
jgi:hypothetical protein